MSAPHAPIIPPAYPAMPPSSAIPAEDPPLNILEVVEPGIDGVIHCVEMLTNGLLEKGHRVSLAYSDRRPGPALSRLVEKVEAAGGSTLNLRVGNAPEAGDVPAFLRLYGLVRRLRPDVIHAHSSKAGALARALPALGVRARFVYTAHAYYGLGGGKDAKTKCFNAIERVLGHVGHSCLTSQGEADFARTVLGLPPLRLHLVRNPVDATHYAPAAETREARATFGLPADAIVLGAVGRFTAQKDPETFYRAVAPIMREEPRLWLLHVGRGELEKKMQALARELGFEDRLVRVPFLERPLTAYQAMDALILSSRYEGLSCVLLEALACNLPLVLSQVAGLADIEPKHLSHCWTAKPGDIAGFSSAIRDWLLDLPARRPCNHRTQALTRFNLNQWLADHLQVYRAAA